MEDFPEMFLVKNSTTTLPLEFARKLKLKYRKNHQKIVKKKEKCNIAQKIIG
jgi:hypothetical protein